jgi:Cu+-exporting ATPase
MLAMIASVTTVLTNSFAGRLLPKRQRGGLKTVSFRVPNMHCDNCLRKIRNAVGKLPGVEEVSGDPAGQVVTVSYHEGNVTRGGIREAIVESGFRAS